MPENQRVCVQLESALMVLVSCPVQCQEFCVARNDNYMKLHCERPMHCAQSKRGPKIFRKGTKRGPDFEQKGDLKGTKGGPKRGPKTQVDRKIEKILYVEIFQKLNLDEEKL